MFKKDYSSRSAFIKDSKKENTVNLTQLDIFIQESLDKFKYSELPEHLTKMNPYLAKLILSSKPTIPDLVIFNKKFNKNDCFFSYDNYSYNSFPRVKFLLKAKKSETSSNAKYSKFVDLDEPNKIKHIFKDLDEVKSNDSDKDVINNLAFDYKNLFSINENKDNLQNGSNIYKQASEQHSLIKELFDEDDTTNIVSNEYASTNYDSNDDLINSAIYTQPTKSNNINKHTKISYRDEDNLRPFCLFSKNIFEENIKQEDPPVVNSKEPLRSNSTKKIPSLEDPFYLIKKNLNFKGFFLKTTEGKLLNNFNSMELLCFLENELAKGKPLSSYYINDYDTDMHCIPQIVYDNLKEFFWKQANPMNNYFKNVVNNFFFFNQMIYMNNAVNPLNGLKPVENKVDNDNKKIKKKVKKSKKA